MRLISKITLLTTAISFGTILIVSCLALYHLHQHALKLADDQAHLILQQRQALINYVTKVLRPQIFKTLEKAGVEDPEFDPSWMSAGYINKKILDETFGNGNFSNYIYKNATVNARNPLNEASPIEKKYLALAYKDTSKKDFHTTLDGENGRKLLHLQVNDSHFGKDCIKCHSTPDIAPAKLVEMYGNKNGFHKIGDGPSLLSLTIPIESIQDELTDELFPLTLIVFFILTLSFCIQWFFSKKIIAQPFEILTLKTSSIANSSELLGETLNAKSFSGEAEKLVHAFNMMSLKLKDERDQLENRVREKTQELREANSKLKKSEERLRLIVNAKTEAIYSTDIEGNCIFCNESCINLLGYTHENDLLGKNMHRLIHHDDRTANNEIECNIMKLLVSGESTHNDDDLFKKADGKTFQVSWSAHPIKKGNETLGAVVTFMDVIEQRSQKMKEVRKNQLASLGEIAAGVAHEINNPINGIINYAELLLTSNDENGKSNQFLEKIIKEGDRIANIVSNLLNFAQKDRGEFSSLDLIDIVTDPINLQSQLFKKDDIHIELGIPDDLPKIHGNLIQLEQVVLNLLSNARYALNKKFPEPSNQKFIVIEAKLSSTKDGECVQLSVKDTGCGIPEEHQDKIFNPFFTTKEMGVGTGLGLSVSNDILKNHGATIYIDSEMNKFTEITINFPVITEGTGN